MPTFLQSPSASGNPLIEPESPFYSPMTQQIANAFPAWTQIRQSTSSVGQQFLNVFGIELQEADRAYKAAIGGLQLSTADINQADILYQVQFPLQGNIDASNIPACVGSGVVLTQLEDVNDFLYRAIPTNIELVSSGTSPVVFNDQLLYDIPYTDQQKETYSLYFQYNEASGVLQKYYIVDTTPDAYYNVIPADNILGQYSLVDTSGIAISGNFAGSCLYWDNLYMLFGQELYLFDVRSPLMSPITSGWYGNMEQNYLQAMDQTTLAEDMTYASGIAYDNNIDYLWIQVSGQALQYELGFDYVIFDDKNQLFLFREQYSDLTIGGTSYLQTYFPVWNWFDEFGLMLDTPRLPGEKNKSYKTRLLEVFQYRANSATQGYINGTSRELNLDYWGYYPSGQYPTNIWTDGIEPSGLPIYESGIYPSGVQNIAEINALFDPNFYNTLVDPSSNIPSPTFVDYTQEILQTFPIVWGSGTGDLYGFIWDLSPFDGGLNYSVVLPDYFGIAYSGIDSMWFQSGVRDPSTNELTVQFVTSGAGNNAAWIPQVFNGSFFINNKPYYLFAQPGEEVIPSGTTYYPIQGSGSIVQAAPIIVYDISGGIEWIQVNTFDNQSPYEYTYNPDPSITFNTPTPTTLNLFYETSPSGWYTIPGWDFNPTHSVIDEGFIWISNEPQEIAYSGSYTLDITPQSLYYGGTIGGSVLQGNLVDIHGDPIAGAEAFFALSPQSSGIGYITSAYNMTGLDGNAYSFYNAATALEGGLQAGIFDPGSPYQITVSGLVNTTDPTEIWTAFEVPDYVTAPSGIDWLAIDSAGDVTDISGNPGITPLSTIASLDGMTDRYLYMTSNNTYSVPVTNWQPIPWFTPPGAHIPVNLYSPLTRQFILDMNTITTPVASTYITSGIYAPNTAMPDDFFNIDLTSLTVNGVEVPNITNWTPTEIASSFNPAGGFAFECDAFNPANSQGKVIIYSVTIPGSTTYIDFNTYAPIKPSGIVPNPDGSTTLLYGQPLTSGLNYIIGNPNYVTVDSWAVYNGFQTATVSGVISLDFGPTQTGVFTVGGVGANGKSLDGLSYIRVTEPPEYIPPPTY